MKLGLEWVVAGVIGFSSVCEASIRFPEYIKIKPKKDNVKLEKTVVKKKVEKYNLADIDYNNLLENDYFQELIYKKNKKIKITKKEEETLSKIKQGYMRHQMEIFEKDVLDKFTNPALDKEKVRLRKEYLRYLEDMFKLVKDIAIILEDNQRIRINTEIMKYERYFERLDPMFSKEK